MGKIKTMRELKQKIAGEITLAKNPGASMKKWREIFGITQTELADYLKITPSTISDYEGNRRRSPGIQVIKRFIDALIELDRRRGGEVLKRIVQEKTSEAFEVREFSEPINAKEFVDVIHGRAITNKRAVRPRKTKTLIFPPETNVVRAYEIALFLKGLIETY